MRIPLPKYDDVGLVTLVEKADEFVTWYLRIKPWICKCRTKNFGRNKQCAGCREPRPPDYIEVNNEY